MEIICLAISVYIIVLFVRIILSWVTMFSTPPAFLAPALKVVYELTDPVLSFVRRYVPLVGGLDLSPFIVFLVLRFLQEGLGCR